jgi:hypothetical protein
MGHSGEGAGAQSPMTTQDTRAARALLAHFNHQLAGRLVRRLLKVENKEAWKRLQSAVFDLLPKAAQDVVWPLVVRFAQTTASEFVDSEEFRKRALAFLDTHAERWTREAVERAIIEQANRNVAGMLKQYDVQQFLKSANGRFQAFVELELKRLATEQATKASHEKKP